MNRPHFSLYKQRWIHMAKDRKVLEFQVEGKLNRKIELNVN